VKYKSTSPSLFISPAATPPPLLKYRYSIMFDCSVSVSLFLKSTWVEEGDKSEKSWSFLFLSDLQEKSNNRTGKMKADFFI
jgi:hypothetical protein